MKYAIYDKAADAYLTKMIFNMGYSENTKFECEVTAYITKAHLLDTKKDATDAVTRIKRFEFMGQPGRFVIHSFDDTLNDQYIISEAGNPTKVVDNITVDLSGTINVTYGTMACHWSATSLNYAVNRLNRIQDASAPTRYSSWNATFDIYKVITIIDEKEHTHYQFINVTAEGIEKYSKDEKESPLNKRITSNWKYLYEESDKDRATINKRIEELEKANYELAVKVAERGIVANRLLDENNSLKAKVEAIKKEPLSKRIEENWKILYENADADREELKNVIDIIHTDLTSATACDDLKDTLKAINCNSGLDNISMENFLTAKDEIRSIINKMITILESHEHSKNTVCAAEKSLNNQLELNYGVCDENRELHVARDCSAEIIYAIRNAICDNNSGAFDCILNRMMNDSDFSSSPFMAGVRENIKDICAAEKKNIANHDLKNGEIARLSEERDKAIERAEFYKRQANSIYGMTVPVRCCGKQVMADILSGKKIPVDKKKYDDLVEYVSNINLTYDTIFCMMDKPVYLSTLTESLNDLTK